MVSGEVDFCTEGLLQQALLRIMRERSARLLLDLSGVTFMDCAGLRALLTTRRRAEPRGGSMRLIAVSPAVRRIIELTGVHEALAVEREPHGPDATHRQNWMHEDVRLMVTTGIEILPEPLARAQAAYRDSTAPCSRRSPREPCR